MRAHNRGEGGSFALLALVSRHLGASRWSGTLVVLGVLAASMFYGDAMLTPAISVLSAVEGLTVVEAGLQPLVLPLAVVILVALFLIQSGRSEEHTSELQSLLRNSYAVFCLKKKHRISYPYGI